MRTITSEVIDKWMERFLFWQKFLQADNSQYVSGKVTLARTKDELGEEEVRVALHITLKPTWKTDFQLLMRDRMIIFSTLEGQEKFDEVEEFICKAEEYWCMPCVQGLRMTTQKRMDEEKAWKEEYRRQMKEKKRAPRGYMRTYEQDECIGYDSARG